MFYKYNYMKVRKRAHSPKEYGSELCLCLLQKKQIKPNQQQKNWDKLGEKNP